MLFLFSRPPMHAWPFIADSIDYNEPRGTVSWAIDVVLDQMVEVPSIASIYDKYLPQLRDVVADRKFKMNNGDTSEPTLDWVFLRKYSGMYRVSSYVCA